MKFLIISSLLLSFGVSAQNRGYAENDGSAPGTFESKQIKPTEEQKQKNKKQEMQQVTSPTRSKAGMTNSTGITTDQMNTSPTTPPTSEAEVIQDSTLSSGPIEKQQTRDGLFDPTNPGEIEAQEDEDALDYSTAPEKDPKKHVDQ